jgi:ABC-type lipoprotein release transport system permease subunit
MLKYLIKSTIEVRVENEEAADTLHKYMQEEAEKIGAVLTSWNETKKEKKSKGEIIEEWYICKYTLAFNDPKEPAVALEDIQYNMMESVPF